MYVGQMAHIKLRSIVWTNLDRSRISVSRTGLRNFDLLAEGMLSEYFAYTSQSVGLCCVRIFELP